MYFVRFLRQEFFILADSRGIVHENKKHNLHFGFYDKYTDTYVVMKTFIVELVCNYYNTNM